MVEKEQLERDLAGIRQQLVGLGKRNRLVHTNRKSKHGNALNIVNERADDIYSILRVSGKKMRFKALLEEDEEEAKELDGIHVAPPSLSQEELEQGYKDKYLETEQTPDALQRRLLRLYREARTAEQEQGVNLLFLAIGFLNWIQQDGRYEKERSAPLILLPVLLVQDKQRSTFNLSSRDDDLAVNLPLQEVLKQEYGVNLAPINETDDWTPTQYFNAIEQAIPQAWSIDRDGMQLGFYSFAKQLMMFDLDPELWPADNPLNENEMLSGLLGGQGLEPQEEVFHEGDRLDEVLEVEEIFHVVDADASQTKVIEEVKKGNNLVVQGPPGTGKSQTISNILASCVHEGKKVLFVAEKMAALNVVHDRMAKAGLQDVCLELHSRAANKKAVIQELGRCLAKKPPAHKASHKTAQLKAAMQRVNAIAATLHTNLPDTDYTPFEAMAECIGFIGNKQPPAKTTGDNLHLLDATTKEQCVKAIQDYLETIETIGEIATHPFRETTNTSLSPVELPQVIEQLRQAAQQGQQLAQELTEIKEVLQLEQLTIANITQLSSVSKLLAKPPPGLQLDHLTDEVLASTDQILTAVHDCEKWQQAAQQQLFTQVETEFSATELAEQFAKANSWFAKLLPGYILASAKLKQVVTGKLPSDAKHREQLALQLLAHQELKQQFEQHAQLLQTVVREHWQGIDTDFTKLANQYRWLAELKQACPLTATQLSQLAPALTKQAITAESFLSQATTACASIGLWEDNLSHQELTEVINRFSEIATNQNKYSSWRSYQLAASKLSAAGLATTKQLIEAGEFADPATAITDFKYAVASARWKHALQTVPELNGYMDLDRHEIVDSFAQLDRDRKQDVQQLILAEHLARLPTELDNELKLIKHEIGKKQRHIPIRRLLDKAGNTIQQIKPVFLMSPLSVAQFLSRGKLQFDVLVADEASQIRPAEALGAIARCKQIVIVGDSKQLPPTTFFEKLMDDSATDEEEEEEQLHLGDLESILTLCTSRGVPQRMLEWHYRSRDPSLIRVSNREFYNNNLILPPTPLQEDDTYGLKLRRVDGLYTSASRGEGRPNTNIIEAKAIVDEIARCAKEEADKSLGVVTFSKAQADMVTELLDVARRDDPALDKYLNEEAAEEVFVKNIENVQGDERDFILITVGYGPNEPGGKTRMFFGPVTRDGGERRLNVLFTRARYRCEVFASFDPAEMNVSANSSTGLRILKKYLEYAKDRKEIDDLEVFGKADSPFEEDVAREIQNLGYRVDAQVGNKGFRIDLAVRHPDKPNQYMLAVECDGATYHSSIWARERDRQRQEILEDQGWKFHRIWSTDWFYRREQELEKLAVALANSK